MLGHRELSFQDYMDILRRRWWLVLAAALVLGGVGLSLSYVLPPEYTSQTLVIVEQQKVPEDYVKPVVSEDLSGRLASMKEQILSRSRLEPMIERYDLFAGRDATMDARVDLTRKAIQVMPIASASNKMPGFYISFKAQNARTAQLVCGEITSLFVSESLDAREESALGTTDFLSQQLADAKKSLDDQDARLAAFQEKYIGKLPDQEQSNMNTLQALTTQLDAATQSLNRMHQDETFMEAMISQEAADLRRNAPSAGVSTDTLQDQLQKLIVQKKDLETLYTPDYPDVVALSREIAELRDEISRNPQTPRPAPGPAAVSHPDSPQLEQTKAQLRSIQASIAAEKQEQARIAGQVRVYEGRIESSPLIEEKFKQVTRDHDTALQFYNSLLTKMNESSMATSLERRQEGEQFQVLDAANLPDSPTFPNRTAFTGGGFAAGMFLGLLVTALIEYRDTSLRNERDVFAFTKLPTLATISLLDGLPPPVREPWNRRWFWRPRLPLESANE